MSTRGGRENGARERPERAATLQATRPATLRQRGVDATRVLREALNLPPGASDAHVLTALSEIAAEEGRRNPRFAEAVRGRAGELAAQHGSSVKPTKTTTSGALPPLVPVRQLGGFREIDPFKPPDPPFIVQVFGHHQLARALQDYTLDKLKQASAEIERQHPSTKPASRTRKADLIAYIVEHTPAE